MEQFLEIFFFLDKTPEILKPEYNLLLKMGKIWGIDMACLCALPNFFNLVLHFFIGGIIINAIMRYGARQGMFFLLLIFGILLSGLSKFIDWITNMLTATGSSVFFSYPLDFIVETLQLLGISIVLVAIFRQFLKTRDNRKASVSTVSI